MRTRIVCWLAIIAPLVWLFGDIVAEQRILNFRDVAHYYRPLWQWTAAQWAAGEVPLWNPLDGFGQPIHADPTASLFYPGQLLFALPVDFTTRLNLYIVLHVLLAASTLYIAARGLGASIVGAAGGAICYAYGGHVLFQYCNPIYLVGASWLPLAALATQRMLTLRSYRWSVSLAIVLALMTLGGDPQLAYHVLLGAALYAWLLWRKERRVVRQASSTQAKEGLTGRSILQRMEGSRLGLIGAAAVVALFLAAIQVLPSAQWSARSERAAFEQPRSVWETGTYLYQVQLGKRQPLTNVSQDIASGLFAPPIPETHHERAYEFSVAPWRWLEFLWPNIGGKMFPLHQRWMTAIPAESRIWTPSLYLGLAPLVAALGTFSLRKKADIETRWLSWLVVWGLLGSLGAYGVGWLVQEASLGAVTAKSLSSPLGGLYWLMVVLLPGYVQFRYPAKLMVLTALGISLLAAKGWDVFECNENRRLRLLAWVLAGGSALLTVAVYLSHGLLLVILKDVQPEFPFGPFDAYGAVRQVLYSLLQTTIVASIIGGLLVWRPKASRCGEFCLWLTALDLAVAHGWLVTSHDYVKIADAPRAYTLPNGEEPMRYHRVENVEIEATLNRLPGRESRLRDYWQWEKNSQRERWYLLNGTNVVDASAGLEPLDLNAFSRSSLISPGIYASSEMMAIDHVIHPNWMIGDDVVAPSVIFISPSRPQQYPRAYLPFAAQGVEPIEGVTPAQLQNESVVDLAPPSAPGEQFAYVEDDEFAAHLPRKTIHFGKDPGECRIERYENNRVDVIANTKRERLLVLADYYAPGWTAELIDVETGASTSTPIYRTNRLLRGVMVPAGEHRVIFRYRPLLFYAGFGISGTAWGFLTVGAMFGFARRFRR